MYSVKEIRENTKVERKFIIRILDIPADYITWLLQDTPITPNQVTILRILLQFLCCIVLLKGTWFYLIFGTVFFQFVMVLDCVDGKLARIKQKFSLNGILLDHIGHHYINTFFIICYSLCVVSIHKELLWILIGTIIVIIMLLEKAIRINPWWFFCPEEQNEIISLFGNKKPSKKYVDIESFFRIENPFGLIFFGTMFMFERLVLLLYVVLYIFILLKTTYSQIMMIKRYETKNV